MFKVTFRFENGETVEGFAAAEENLLEVARKTNVAIEPLVPVTVPAENVV